MRAFLRDNLGRVCEGSQLVKRMEEAGIVDIKTDYGSIPVCWGGYIGKLVYEVKTIETTFYILSCN